MLVVTLPDGSKREFEAPVRVADVAQSIGSGLAKAALGGIVDGKMVDTSFVIDKDSQLAIITDKSPEALEIVDEVLHREERLGLDRLDAYVNFNAGIKRACDDLKSFLARAKAEGKRVCGMGASTKGNVLLQYCKLTADDIEVIGEVNSEKFGAMTPGTWIPIEDEKKVLASRPDYLIVLPWHFRDNFLSNPAYRGHRLVFPLPKLEVVSL